MINKVDGQHNYTNAYERQKRKAGRVEADAPAFLLDYDEKGVVWERSPEQKKGQVPKESVFSGEKKKPEEEKQEKEPQPEEPSAAETADEGGSFFKGIVQRLRGLLRGFLQLVWYSSEEGKTEPPAEEETEAPAPAAGGKPARNTSVLTGYDRRGHLVKPDDAEAGRLLHPEKSGNGTGLEVRSQGTYRKYI